MRVIWEPRASDEVLRVYQNLDLAGQRELGDALEGATQALGLMPEELGEGRGGRMRVWVTRRATLWYEVRPDEVRVLRVRFPGMQPPGGG